MNPDIPIVLATGSEWTVRLTVQIADGWLLLGFRPGTLPEYQPWLEQGCERAGDARSMNGFKVHAGRRRAGG
jgi:alkanesulfonate monooxygenase SsuD/methylene tetrahydromethanopterin reductase-like flavin-dependent oxidoreductase (luciferase family)